MIYIINVTHKWSVLKKNCYFLYLLQSYCKACPNLPKHLAIMHLPLYEIDE